MCLPSGVAETAEPRFVIPPAFRRRVSRIKLRKLLTTGIDVHWGKSISGFRPTESGISVSLTDGTEIQGSLLAAADGSGSKIRQLLMGDELGCLNQLPAHYLAVELRRTQDEVSGLRGIDPLLFQGSHPETGYYMWYSTLSTPEVNGSSETTSPYYEAQINVSWLIRGPGDHMPETNAGKLAKFKSLATAGTGFEKTLRELIENIPDTQVFDISLADRPTVPWHGLGGRVTMLGDAANPMTMYRGEAANHGLTDAMNLIEQLKL
ncbi:hypothetical protein CLAIMM_11288 [Cladophialophora immunda]|nr:hypothetical protein CLAIMM_11288 [Cladophialophora immunda]